LVAGGILLVTGDGITEKENPQRKKNFFGGGFINQNL